jgi:RsiW-degrading membrane proteinase PrsW (M82 family)
MNWHFMEGDKQIGPLSAEEIGSLIEAGKLTQDTLVWNETLTNWIRLIDSGLVEADEDLSQTPRSSSAPSAPEANPANRLVQEANQPPAAQPSNIVNVCPYCGESVRENAKKCRFCGEFLDDELRKKNDTITHRVSYNPINQVKAFVRWFTGYDRLQGFHFRQLFVEIFSHFSKDDVESVFECGGPRSTPPLKDVRDEWPRPWFFWRILLFGSLIYIGFLLGLIFFANPKLLPGFMIVGAFFVPFAFGILFFEYNVLRNISLYQILKCMLVGGILSILISLFLFEFTGLGRTFLGATAAGIVEETGKLLTATLLLCTVSGRRWILNGVLVGAAVGVGFAGFETAGYILEAGRGDDFEAMNGTLIMRALFAPFCHVAWTAITAGALWRDGETRLSAIELFFSIKFLRVFAFVMLLHMFWNSGMLFTSTGYNLLLGWLVSILGSWYLAFLVIQEGLQQVKAEKEKVYPSKLLNCQGCGMPLLDGAKFCGNCGFPRQ